MYCDEVSCWQAAPCRVHGYPRISLHELQGRVPEVLFFVASFIITICSNQEVFQAVALLVASLLQHSFAYVTLPDGQARDLQSALESFSQCFQEQNETSVQTLRQIPGVTYQSFREKQQLHFQHVGEGWQLNSDNSYCTLANRCWKQLECVGFECLDVLLEHLQMPRLAALLSLHCDPSPLPAGHVGNSVFDVFLYQPDRAGCPEHWDPGFVSVIKDTAPGLQCEDLQLKRMVDVHIGDNEAVVILNQALHTVSKVCPTNHRVVRTSHPRTSMIYELRPNTDFYSE